MRVCMYVCIYACMHARVSLLFPWQRFTKLLILLSLFSPLATPPCITAFRLLRSLSLSFLIDMQQPTSLNCVFYAPWFSALSSSLMFPFLGWLHDVSIYCLLLPWQVRVPFSFTRMWLWKLTKHPASHVQCVNARWSFDKSSAYLYSWVISLFTRVFKRITVHSRSISDIHSSELLFYYTVSTPLAANWSQCRKIKLILRPGPTSKPKRQIIDGNFCFWKSFIHNLSVAMTLCSFSTSGWEMLDLA